MPVETQERTPSAVFRALISADVDPGLAHDAAEEVRDRAGENIIAAIQTSKDQLRAEMGQLRTEMGQLRTEMEARFEVLVGMIQATQRESQAMQREMQAMQREMQAGQRVTQREISTLRWMIGVGFTLLGLSIAIAAITQG